jgi:hypothetical protein
MIHTVDPRQNRLFDPFQGVIPPAGQRIIAEGWQGVFRHQGQRISISLNSQYFGEELVIQTAPNHLAA